MLFALDCHKSFPDTSHEVFLNALPTHGTLVSEEPAVQAGVVLVC